MTKKLSLLKLFLPMVFGVSFISFGYCEDMAQCLKKNQKEDCECRVKCDLQHDECLKRFNSPKSGSSELKSCNQASMSCWMECLGQNKEALKNGPGGMITKATSNPKIFNEKLNLPAKDSVPKCASLVKEVEELYSRGKEKKCELGDNEKFCEELAFQFMVKAGYMSSCINGNYPR